MDRAIDGNNLEEVDRNARAYGFEIGRGASLDKKITTSPDNPFLDPDWRKKVVDNESLPEVRG